MPRPPKPRSVEFLPEVACFKPAGVPMAVLDEVRLGVDELEALRLKDLEGLDQEECARRMSLAQSTYQRLLTSAREKLTRGIVEGKAIRIEGGPYKLVARTFVCPECGNRWRLEPEVTGSDAPRFREAGSVASSSVPSDCPTCGRKLVPWYPGAGRARHGVHGGADPDSSDGSDGSAKS